MLAAADALMDSITIYGKDLVLGGKAPMPKARPTQQAQSFYADSTNFA